MMEINTVLVLGLVVLGAVVQTLTGFAMGLVIIAGVTAFDLADISFTAAVVSFISLTNAGVALRSHHRLVDRSALVWISAGLLPFLVLGMVLLAWLSEVYYDGLKLLLGLVIIVAGFSLMLTPNPYQLRSSRWVLAGYGMVGGTIAGLYSAGGAPLAYIMYRQPLSLDTIRYTLLAVFAVSTFWRAVVAAVAGHIDLSVLMTVALSIPLVIVTTVFTARVAHLLPDRFIRRLVFVLLIGVGAFLIIG